jgi:hypothetical protein
VQAQQYLNNLPATLLALPQWAQRRQRADCLGLAESEIRSQCLQQSQQVLAEQVTLFMDSNS